MLALEAETGCAKVVVFDELACRQRQRGASLRELLLGSQMFGVGGTLQVEDESKRVG